MSTDIGNGNDGGVRKKITENIDEAKRKEKGGEKQRGISI